MMEAVKGFNGQLERIAELVVVMVVGRDVVLHLCAFPSRLVPAAPVFLGAPRFSLVGLHGGDRRVARSSES